MKRRVMPSKPGHMRTEKPREILCRTGCVSAFEVGVEAAEIGRDWHPSALNLAIRGEFQNPLAGATSFEVLVVEDQEDRAKPDRIQHVGFILRCKPVIDCVVTVSAPEFQTLIALATVGRLTSLELRFERPRYGSSRIKSARFSSGWVSL